MLDLDSRLEYFTNPDLNAEAHYDYDNTAVTWQQIIYAMLQSLHYWARAKKSNKLHRSFNMYRAKHARMAPKNTVS